MSEKIIFENIKSFDLQQTLECGQCFRFNKLPDDSYDIVALGRAVNVKYSDNTLTITNASESDRALWSDYFDLSLDYESIKDSLSQLHPVLKEASSYAGGIRILRQEPFEALITFIISQNNNISRIKGIIDRLCTNFGEKIDDTHYAFPTPERLASLKVDDLAPIRAGFRHRYIIDGAKRVHNGEVNLFSLYTLDYNLAQQELRKILGVGTKVADCVLLYGFHRLEAFPLDVWMKRAMSTLFDDMDPSLFGQYGGIAQQYIFHYSRMHKDLFEGA